MTSPLNRVVEVNGVYPSRPSGGYTDFLGIADPSALMQVGDTWTQLPTVPGAPTIGTATGGDAAASVAFTPPASNGGASITGYTATSTPGGITGTGSSSPITVSGLTNGTAYTFTVHATNSVGNSAESAASNSVTPAGGGAAPTFGAQGTPLAAASATTASVPAPPAVVANSVVLVFLVRDDASASGYESITPPAGWALVGANPGFAHATDTSHDVFCDVFWHRASGAESGTYDFSWVTSRFATAVAVRIDGCRTSGNPFDVENGAASSGPVSTSTPAVSVTTTGTNRLLVWAGWTWTGGGWTMPSGFTQVVSNVPFDLLTVGTNTQAAAGSSGTLVGSQVSEPHGAWVGAFVGV